MTSGAFITIDMEQYRYRDLVHHIVEDAISTEPYCSWPDLGMVVHAYLRDADESIARLAGAPRQRDTPITVRLVKGAYWDEEAALADQEEGPPPVFLEKASTDANYEHCTAALLAAYPHIRPAFGTHNPRSISQAMVRAEHAGLPRERVEFQMLFGMAEGLRASVQEAEYRTRVYVPAGAVIPGMAYLVRPLFENTSSESWLLHRHEEGAPEELLRRPLAQVEPPTGPTAFANAQHPRSSTRAPTGTRCRQRSKQRVPRSPRHPLHGGRELESAFATGSRTVPCRRRRC